MIGRKFCIARRHSKRLLICGAPPQTAPRPVIGELENRNISVPMTFSPRACCIRHRLPDHAVKDGGVVTADAQPDIPGFPRPRPPRSGPRSFYGSGDENATTNREPGVSPASAFAAARTLGRAAAADPPQRIGARWPSRRAEGPALRWRTVMLF